MAPPKNMRAVIKSKPDRDNSPIQPLYSRSPVMLKVWEYAYMAKIDARKRTSET